MNENVTNKFEKTKDIILLLLLGIWMLIPILKNLRIAYDIAYTYEYTFIKIVGAIGLFFLLLDIYKNLKCEKNRKEYEKNILPITILCIFMIWTFISAIFAENIKYAFNGHEYRKEGYITYLCYAGFFSCAFLMKSKLSKKCLINMFIGIAVLNIIMVGLANRGILTEILVKRPINRTGFYNSNHYGYYLLLATITVNFLFITEKNKYIKVVYIIIYSFLLYYLILNNTFGVYLALAIALMLFTIYCIYCKKKIFISILSILIFILMSLSTQEIRTITQNNINSLFKDMQNIVAAQQIKDDVTETEEEEDIKEAVIKKAEKAGTNRMRLWKNGVKFFLENPILGYGPDNLESKYIEVGINRDRPHNLLIQLATTSGIIGLVTYMVAIGIILIRGLKTMKIDNAMHLLSFFSVVAYLISAMFGNSMYYTSPYFFIFLGLLMFENVNAKKIEE